jgi:hypothetical protein
MAAAGWLPTLSQIQAVPSAQLREAARTWRAAATRWEDVLARQRDEAAQKVVWRGATANALEGRTYGDWVTAVGKAGQLHKAAGIAELGADRFEGAREHALDAVVQARADGFRVAEDLSVTDTRTGGSREERAARQILAQEHAAYIRHGAAGLVTVDREISANLLAVTDELGTISFDETPIPGIDDAPSHETEHNGVQAVGYGRQPEAPSPGDPAPPDQPTKTAEDVRKALDPLPDGKNEPVKTLPTPEEIRKTFEDLTQNAPDAPRPTYKGERRVLDDGTVIGIRPSRRWGPTLDVKYPDGTEQKIHLPEPIKGANPPPVTSVPQTPSVISAPPMLPPELNLLRSPRFRLRWPIIRQRQFLRSLSIIRPSQFLPPRQLRCRACPIRRLMSSRKWNPASRRRVRRSWPASAGLPTRTFDDNDRTTPQRVAPPGKSFVRRRCRGMPCSRPRSSRSRRVAAMVGGFGGSSRVADRALRRRRRCAVANHGVRTPIRWRLGRLRNHQRIQIHRPP